MNTITEARTGGRIHYIDNLRIFLTMLVVCHHLAMGFGAPGGWYYVTPALPSPFTIALLSLFVIINQSFFMSLFFFVSAYFTPRSLDKKNTNHFLRDRLKRLGIPLTVYFLLLNPTLAYISFRFRGEKQYGYLKFMLQEGHRYFGWGPLWFVFSLLLFTAVYLLIYRWFQHHSSGSCALAYPSNKRVLLFVLGITVLTFLVRIIFSISAPVCDLKFAFFPTYIAFFVFGIHAFRADWLGRLDNRQVRFWFSLAVVSILALPVIFEVGGASRGLGNKFEGGFTLQSLMFILCETIICVGVSMKLLSLFQARLNMTSPLTALLSKSAYTVYIIHPFVVITATFLARNWSFPPLLSFLLLLPPVIAVSFIVGHFISRLPLLNKVL